MCLDGVHFINSWYLIYQGTSGQSCPGLAVFHAHSQRIFRHRRLLRKISSGDVSDVGNTSTLLDAAVVSRLILGAKQIRDGNGSIYLGVFVDSGIIFRETG